MHQGSRAIPAVRSVPRFDINAVLCANLSQSRHICHMRSVFHKVPVLFILSTIGAQYARFVT